MEKIDVSQITFRAAKQSDALEHFRAVQESYAEASEFLPDFEGMEKWTVAQHKIYLKKFGADSRTHKNYLFFYGDKIIGGGYLGPSAWEYSGELMYWVRSGWDGVGIGLFIAQTMLKSAYQNFGYRYLIIQTDRNNIGSKKVAEKLGAWVGSIIGYRTHRGEDSNMIIWVKETPFTAIAKRYDQSYEWNPFHKNGTVFRIDYENKQTQYMQHDLDRVRKK
jgi:RimJ/RimL family protein N-acetyltransferase